MLSAMLAESWVCTAWVDERVEGWAVSGEWASEERRAGEASMSFRSWVLFVLVRIAFRKIGSRTFCPLVSLAASLVLGLLFDVVLDAAEAGSGVLAWEVMACSL